MNYIFYCLIASIGYASSLSGQQLMEGIDRAKIMSKVPVSQERIRQLSPDQTVILLSPNGEKILVYEANARSYALLATQSGEKIINFSKHVCCEDVPSVRAFDPSSTLCALATHCHTANQDILKVVDGSLQEQVLFLPDFNSESIAISVDGLVIACAGGCSDDKLLLFKRQSDNQFKLIRSFERGHLIALNATGTCLAALNHDNLTIYDISSSELPKKIFDLMVHHAPYLRFKRGNELIVGVPESQVFGENIMAQSVAITKHADNMYQASIAQVGNKVLQLKNGAPCITYSVDDQEFSVGLPKTTEKITQMVLHDQDTQLTACGDGHVYRYDLKKLAQAEHRFIKPIEEIELRDRAIAKKVLKMSDDEFEHMVMQENIEPLPQIDKDICALFKPAKQKSCNDTINRICYPLVGIAAAAMALCALRN